MTSNGFLLEQYADQIVNSRLDYLSLSLDHYKSQKHDRIKGKKNSFKRLMNGLNYLVKIRKNTPYNIKLNTVITRDNYQELTDMQDYIDTLGVDEWSLQHFSYTTPQARKKNTAFRGKTGIGSYVEGAAVKEPTYLSNEQISILHEQLHKIKKKQPQFRTKVTIKPDIDSLEAYYSGRFPSRTSSCTLPFDTVSIFEDGKITLCLGKEIGNLESGTIKAAWHSPAARNFRKLLLKQKLFPPCFRCCNLKYRF